ncbi:MAG: TonB-dependent receptor [Bacteroidota bacterium]|nr:TonB-dependent receptor [Bacteroidota bacterium]
MKLTFVLIIVNVLAVSASGYSQSARLTLNLKNATLKEAISSIESKSGLSFLYKAGVVNGEQKVNLSASNATVQEVLDKLFSSKEVEYKILENSLVVLLPSTKQQDKITGTVTDSSTGETLPGVSISVEGSNSGAVTDNEGKFSVKAPVDAVLLFSFVGYTSQRISIAGKSQISIKLVPDIQKLEEVVVVGYGTQKKATLTGAISQVGSEVFKDKTVSNAALALQGEVPGLVITRTSSRPGNEGLSIRLRGESSINATDPLIIVDGVPLLDTWELSQISTDDIESVSALKDASASIYGARAAGGVILVTTKRGKSGKIKVNYDGNIRINTIGIKTPWANMSQWATEYLKASYQDKIYDWTNKVEWATPVQYLTQPAMWTNAVLQQMTLGQPFESTDINGKTWGFADNNYFNTLYGNSTSQQHNLSLQGGTDKTTYRASVGYANNQSVLKVAYDGEKKYNVRLNYDYKITDKIKLETGLSYDDRIISSPKNGIGAGYFDPPVFPTYNKVGQFYDDYSGTRNPVSQIKLGGRINNKESIIRLNSKISAEIINGLTLSATAAYVNRNGWKEQYDQNYQNYNWLGTLVGGNCYPNAGIQEDLGNTRYQTYGAFVDYKKTFGGKHNISFTGGYSGELNEVKTVMAKRINLVVPGLYNLNVGDNSSGSQTNGGSASAWGILSWIGRLNYDYDSKYLLEMQGRRDGSSKFAPGYKWSNFGSVLAGWRISEEKLVKDLNIFDNLKIRTGYGEMGGNPSANGIGNYDYVSQISATGGTVVFGSTAATQQAALPQTIVSYTRTWERIRNANVGLDFSVLKNRLSGTFELFQKRNIGMFIPINYAQILGAPTYYSGITTFYNTLTNSGTLKTTGWEAILNWNDKIGGLKYQVGIQLSNNKNLITSYAGTDVAGSGKISTRENYPMNSLFVYKTAGYFKDQADVDAYYVAYGGKGNLAGNLLASDATARLRPGDLKVVDRNGDGVIDAKDTYYYGDVSPHYTFGINLGLQWKGFDFSTFLQGVGRQYLLRTGNARAPFYRNYLNINTTYIGKTWTTENPNAQYPRESFVANKNNWNWNANDVNVQNLSYVRMKSLILGYSLPKSIISKAKIDKLRVYFSGGDLFEFTTIKDGYDPEFQESSDSNYPFLRTYSFGLDITF